MPYGIIVVYSPDVRAGLIKGDDGSYFGFSDKEWMCPSRLPVPQESVAFSNTGLSVREVMPERVLENSTDIADYPLSLKIKS